MSNGNAVISPVLTASPAQLTPALIAKMNVLQGLEIAYDLQHNFGGCCGAYGRDQQLPQYPRATIDQLIAYAPVVYPSISSVKRRSVQIGSRFAQSGWFGFKTPGDRSSGVGSQLGMNQSSWDMYSSLLTGTPTTGGTARPPVVDRVLDSYKSRVSTSEKRTGSRAVPTDQRTRAGPGKSAPMRASGSAGCQFPSNRNCAPPAMSARSL